MSKLSDRLRDIQMEVYGGRHRAVNQRVFQRFIRRRRQLLVASFPMPISGRVLDVGCGEGRFLKGMFDSKHLRLYGLDLTHVNCQTTQERLPDAGVVQGDAEKLPFRANMFDLVFVNGVFHHVSNQVAMAEELIRIAAPGGWVVIIEPNRLNPLYASVAILKRHERGLFHFNAYRLYQYIGTHLVSIRLYPFNHLDFPCYGIPPKVLEWLVDIIHQLPTLGITQTHFLIVGRKQT